MRIRHAVVVIVGIAGWSSSVAAETVEGQAQAVSGDILRIGTETFFLNGIVAPAGDTGSQNRLAEVLAGHSIVCEVQAISQGSHRTAVCSRNGVDISSQMVRSGLAFAYAENHIDLSALQSAARDEGLGFWDNEEVGLLAVSLGSGVAAPRDCAIKGNKSHQAPYKLYYHSPDTAYYGRTRINLQQGEKWFCSEADAEAAGFGVAPH